MEIFSKLAKINKNSYPKTFEKYRKNLTREAISKEYDYSREIGMLGEAVEALYNMIGEIHPNIKADEAFIAWRERVVELKESIKGQLEE